MLFGFRTVNGGALLDERTKLRIVRGDGACRMKSKFSNIDPKDPQCRGNFQHNREITDSSVFRCHSATKTERASGSSVISRAIECGQ